MLCEHEHKSFCHNYECPYNFHLCPCVEFPEICRLYSPRGVGEWISTALTVPADDKEVLICSRSKNGSRSIDKGYYTGERWAHRGTAEVTHWMPLPELPKE